MQDQAGVRGMVRARGHRCSPDVCEALEPGLIRQSYPASQSPRAPPQQGIGPGLIAQRGAPRAAGYAACRQGAGAHCDADREGSDPSSRGFRPSQRSQASPRPPAPRALGCASPISWRCRRQAMASNVIGAPCSLVFSHRIFRKCGGGFMVQANRAPLLGLTARPCIRGWRRLDSTLAALIRDPTWSPRSSRRP